MSGTTIIAQISVFKEITKFCFKPPIPLTLGLGSKGQNSTISEHGHVANQFKGNHECSNMVANVLHATPHDPSE